MVRQRRTIIRCSIYETPTFVEEAAKIWSDAERLEFFVWIAGEPEAGDVIAGSGGCRKVRWSRRGVGKRSGARVIYFSRLAAGELCMLLVYSKVEKDSILGHVLKKSEWSLNMATRKVGSPTTGEALGLKLLQSVKEMQLRHFARATELAINEVVEARQSMGMSQAEFASALHISKRTLQEWEQGRRSPTGAARALVRIAKLHPEVLRESLV